MFLMELSPSLALAGIMINLAFGPFYSVKLYPRAQSTGSF